MYGDSKQERGYKAHVGGKVMSTDSSGDMYYSGVGNREKMNQAIAWRTSVSPATTARTLAAGYFPQTHSPNNVVVNISSTVSHGIRGPRNAFQTNKLIVWAAQPVY